MFLPIRRLLRDKDAPIEQQGTLDLSAEDYPGFVIPGPVAYTLHAAPEGGGVRLALAVTAVLRAECARCLAQFELPMRFERTWRLREEDLDDPDAEFPFTQDGRLDVKELVHQETLLEADPILLCREDCEGLCSQCGQPKASCHCPPVVQADPRLQALQALRDLLAESKE